MSDDENVEDAWAEALEEQAESESSDAGENNTGGPGDTVNEDSIARANFEDLDEGEGDSNVELDMILDIPVTLSVEIGSTKINISNLLKLNQGSVIELDRLAGEPMDVVVNGTLIAHGEVVVVNEKFGIRLTDVLSASERIKNMG